ncbi:unnamed protein product, partial [Medioppia subpectinata]
MNSLLQNNDTKGVASNTSGSGAQLNRTESARKWRSRPLTYRCEYCIGSNIFATDSKSYFETHHRNCHPKALYCDLCLARFETLAERLEHQIYCTVSKIYICDQMNCYFECTDSEAFDEHRRQHTAPPIDTISDRIDDTVSKADPISDDNCVAKSAQKPNESNGLNESDGSVSADNSSINGHDVQQLLALCLSLPQTADPFETNCENNKIAVKSKRKTPHTIRDDNFVDSTHEKTIASDGRNESDGRVSSDIYPINEEDLQLKSLYIPIAVPKSTRLPLEINCDTNEIAIKTEPISGDNCVEMNEEMSNECTTGLHTIDEHISVDSVKQELESNENRLEFNSVVNEVVDNSNDNGFIFGADLLSKNSVIRHEMIDTNNGLTDDNNKHETSIKRMLAHITGTGGRPRGRPRRHPKVGPKVRPKDVPRNRCPDCNPSLSTSIYYHCKNHALKTCPLCDLPFKGRHALVDHLSACKAPQTRYQRNLKRHVRRVHTTECYRCRQPIDETMIRSHLQKCDKRLNVAVRKCPIDGCDYQSISGVDIKGHKLSMHSIGSDLQCNKCSFKCTTFYAYNQHVLRYHNTKKRRTLYKCEKCHKCFHTLQRLNAHVIWAHSSKPLEPLRVRDRHQCHYRDCGGTFRRASDLVTHVGAKHTPLLDDWSEYLFKCEICGDLFKGQRLVGRHLDSLHKLNGRKYWFKCGSDGCGFESISLRGINDHKRDLKHVGPYVLFNKTKGQSTCESVAEVCGSVGPRAANSTRNDNLLSMETLDYCSGEALIKTNITAIPDKQSFS